MSGSTSLAMAAAAAGGGGDCYRPPFTAVQWQELEHQALIYKYLVAGVPVPSDLVVPIRRSLEALSARFFNHPNSLSYCSYYGKKFDPEPGRCRRTDGKKWRCSKDAYPDSKYCERHMHRGRNRSRKPVESQSTSKSLSTAMSNTTTVSSTGSGNGSYQSVGGGSFQNSYLYPVTNSGSFDFRSNVSKLQADTSPYGINNNNFRYAQKVTVEVDDQNYSSGASGNVQGLGMESNVDNTWGLMPTQVPTLKSTNDSYLQSNSSQLNIASAYDHTLDATLMSKQRQQYCFFGSEISSPVQQGKHEQQSMRPFFDEWPKSRESWSDPDVDGKNSLSTTQLSISTSDCTPHVA